VFLNRRVRWIRRLPRVAVADHPGRANWFHWLCQTLPQIEYLAGQGYTQIAVCAETDWQWETAQAAGKWCGVEVIRRGAIEWLPARGEGPSARTIQFLRAVFLTGVDCPSCQGWPCEHAAVARTSRRRLFISRAACATRHILNEPELRAALEPLDFEFIRLETLDAYTQGRLFAEAAMVVGAHGSGLANVVFCGPGTVVVEIRGPQEERGWVARLCDAARCIHRPIVVADYDEQGPIRRVPPAVILDLVRGNYAGR
jgi:capsular polysaccharide biosynthesis protein